ncbi:hypothetical protein JTB14_030848 [Gonioctena quinquepunctata]|nr:hypothetical protein JTB14_030848 [Gonioctena quinquepunctata]
MSSRIKRLVELALKVESNSISTAENGELCSTSKKSNSENSFCEDYLENKLGKEGNPWKEFNEWKEKQIEINGNVESNHNEKSTDFIDSSTSWIPDEAKQSDSTSGCPSGISEEIAFQKLLQYQEKNYTYETMNNFKNTTLVSEEQTPVSISDESQRETMNDTQNMTSGREEQTPASISDKIQQDIRPKLEVLQNVILHSTEEKFGTNVMQEKKRIKIENIGVIGDTNKLVEVSQRKSRIWNKKDRCVYCDRDCTNFSRHLFRNHEREI